MSAMRADEPGRTYLLVDSLEGPLARAELTGSPDSPNLQLRITEGDPDAVERATLLQAVPMDDRLPMRIGHIVQRRERLMVLEGHKGQGMEARKNLRMPVRFESLLYFERGGRTAFRSLNLSCGGIAFYCAGGIPVGGVVEVVIPITAVDPAVIRAQVLRTTPADNGETLYACKFLDLLPEEEARVREAVFHVQVKRGRVLSANS